MGIGGNQSQSFVSDQYNKSFGTVASRLTTELTMPS